MNEILLKLLRGTDRGGVCVYVCVCVGGGGGGRRTEIPGPAKGRAVSVYDEKVGVI